MRTLIGLLVVAVILGGVTGFFVARHENGPVAQRAMAAYKAGDYATAAPLLKKWAESIDYKKDPKTLGTVLTYLADAESKVKGTPVVVTLAPPPPTPATAPSVAAAPTSAPATAVAAASGGIMDPTTGKVRIPHGAPLAGVNEMTIKELGNFDFDATTDTDVPADVKTFSGATVRLRGFMIPLTQAETITDFALVPSLVGCCFGQPPGVQHTITCKAPAGKAVQYTVDEVWVEGKLKVNVQRDSGYTYSIFDMDVTSVKPVG